MAGGRPRGFSREAALDRALELFWRRGYEGTSVADLTDEMDVSRPSLYAAFGDKEELFRAVVARYEAQYADHVRRALERPQIADAIRTLLLDAAAALTAPDRPAGCLLVHGALACDEENAAARDLLAAARLSRQAAIRARLEGAAGQGDLAPDGDPVLLAEYVMALLSGMAVQAIGGASRDALTAVAELGLRVLELDQPGTAARSGRGRGPIRRAGKPDEPGPDQFAMDL